MRHAADGSLPLALAAVLGLLDASAACTARAPSRVPPPSTAASGPSGPEGLVAEVQPPTTAPGNAVSVRGGPFGDAAGVVLVDGAPAEVLAWSDRHLVARVPDHASSRAVLEVRTARGTGRAPLDVRPSSPPPTFVTLSFDDTYASHRRAAALLEAHGMRGTFYVNSVRLDHGGYLARRDVEAMAQAGHEIGGHSLHHLWLPDLAEDEQRRQVCDDRARLLDLGLAVRSFAYPGGFQDEVTRRVVAGCGYASARIVSGGVPEALPPADPLAIRISDTMRSVVELPQLESWVTRFEGRGAWVNLVFHDVCDGCASSAIPPARLEAFVTWLAARAARGTYVHTFSELASGALLPAVHATPATSRVAGTDDVPNGSLEEASDHGPSCWQRGDPGQRRSAWSRTRDAAHGAWAERLDGAGTTTLDARRLRTFRDAGACAIRALPGARLRLAVHARGASRLAPSVAFRSADGHWTSWRDGDVVMPSGGAFRRFELDLPLVPGGVDAVAVGLVALDPADLVVDDVHLVAPPVTP